MSRINPDKLNNLPDQAAKAAEIEFLGSQNAMNIQLIISDIAQYRAANGDNGGQIRGGTESMFRNYISTWMLYLLSGAEDIADDIQNDATLPWLDDDADGQTIRQRIIDRIVE